MESPQWNAGLRAFPEAAPGGSPRTARGNCGILPAMTGSNGMGSLIVTGGAGFIGSNFVRLALARGAERIVVVDKLTYAGHRESLEDALADPRAELVVADIADAAAMERLFTEVAPAGVVNFAAETHVEPLHRRARRLRPDQRGRHVRPAGGGAALAPRRLGGRAGRLPLRARLYRRGLRLARARGRLLRDDALRA